MRFKKLVIVGPGLIGGSVGLAARAAGLAERVVGVGHRQSSLDEARARGAIDEGSLDAAAAAEKADFVLLCTRVGLFGELAAKVAPRMSRGGIISDVGSAKTTVAAAIESAIAGRRVEYVGSHPLAGSEQRGIEAARADLFRGSCCVVTPSRSSSPESLRRVAEFWTALGARVVEMTSVEHDDLVAQMSHLPHVLAALLVNAASDAALKMSGRGFRDMTRIASGDASLWRDICAANRENLSRALEKIETGARAMRAALAAGDDDAVEKTLARAAKRRDQFNND